MIRIAPCLSRVLLSLVLLAGLWMLSAEGRAQPAAGAQRLNPVKDFTQKDGREEYSQFQAMRKGEQPPNKDIIDHAAQWYAYRLTHSEYYDPSGKGDKNVRDLVKEVSVQVLPVPLDPRKPLNGMQQQFNQEFSRRLGERLKEVLKNGRPIVRINAAQVLAKLAESGQEELVDVLVDIIKNPQESDAVKLYAFKGLGTLLSLTRGENPLIKIKKEREERAILALQEYITRQPTSAGASPEEVEAIRFVRREAIRALAESRYPAIEVVKDKKKSLEALTALLLLRILKGESLTPEPSTSEQVEAAIGVCQLQSRPIPEYQPDYAAHHVARFVVEFAVRSDKEKGESRTEPWKLLAARLYQAVLELKTDTDVTRNPAPVRQYVNKVEAQVKPVLDAIVNGGSPNIAPLSTWLDANQPPNSTLYKGMAEAVLKTQEKEKE